MKPSPLTLKALKLTLAVQLTDYAIYLHLRSRRLQRATDAAQYLAEARFFGRDAVVQLREYARLFTSALKHAAVS